METPLKILCQLRPQYRYKPKDHTSIWSRVARRPHRYNRMDPDPEPQHDAESRPTYTKEGETKCVSRKDEWRTFWVGRLRKIIDVPHLTDKDISDAVERSRRIYFQQKEADSKPCIDPDLPSCFYWNKYEVIDWAESVGFSDKIKEMFLHFGISGRQLVTLDANNLLKMGLYELGAIKKITKSIRDVLGLPHTNGLRATARVPPLETFLKLKVRTGPNMDKFTFKNYCEQQNIEYEAAKNQIREGYQPIPGCCRVEILPNPKAKVKWIPIPMKVQKPNKAHHASDYDLPLSDDSYSSSGSGNSLLLDNIPTVEELCNNVLLRNTFIPQILNDIVEAVFNKIADDKRNREENRKNKQDVADEVVTNHLNKAYSDFSVNDPEDKLKFVTIVAEELVEDVLRAREILEDIENFQKWIKTEIPKEDMQNLQEAVAHYVNTIMPVVVSAALKEMEKSSSSLNSEIESRDSGLQSRTVSSTSSNSQNHDNHENAVEGDDEDDDFKVVWERESADENFEDEP